MGQQAGESKSQSRREIEKQGIQFSLLDITYPYYHSSMLSKSKFFGFECLMFECGIYFCLLYTVANYLNRGYILQWHTLNIITSNLIHDASAMTTGLVLAFIQMHLARPLLTLLRSHPQQTKLLYVYCGVWLLLFVVGGLMVMQTVEFYFTDRIFIVVVSWSLPVKTASYCIDQLQMSTSHIDQPSVLLEARKREREASPLRRLLLQLKFIVSPKVIYKQFLIDHNPALPIHISYLCIKAVVSGICLLINYILMTEFIAPYLQPEVYGRMSFIELFFKLIPLAFYVNICLYYLIMENIMLAMAEITQLQRRHFYHDWWNAETVSQFLDKWVLLIAAFSNTYLPTVPKRWKHLLHLTIIFLMLFSVFGEELNLKMLIFAAINMSTVFFLGENKQVQSNYLVHFLTISFTPFSLAAELKYSIFS